MYWYIDENRLPFVRHDAFSNNEFDHLLAQEREVDERLRRDK